MQIDGEYLSNLRFADDVLISANTPYELQHMLPELTDESENQSLKMIKSKTKVVMENDTPINVNKLRPRTVKATSTRDSTRDKTQDKEIHRRISAGWIAFAKHPENFKGNIGTCLKRQVYNLCVLPAMTYGAETWALTTQAKKQASSRTNKDGKECVKHHIQGQKNKHLGKGKDTVTHT